MITGKYVPVKVATYVADNQITDKVINVDRGQGAFTAYYADKHGNVEIIGHYENKDIEPLELDFQTMTAPKPADGSKPTKDEIEAWLAANEHPRRTMVFYKENTADVAYSHVYFGAENKVYTVFEMPEPIRPLTKEMADTASVDYPYDGRASFKTLDEIFLRKKDYEIYITRAEGIEKQYLSGKLTYKEDKLTTAGNVVYHPGRDGNVGKWTVDPITELAVPADSIVYFTVPKDTIHTMADVQVGQAELVVAPLATFVPSIENIPVGYSDGKAVFTLTNGRTSLDPFIVKDLPLLLKAEGILNHKVIIKAKDGSKELMTDGGELIYYDELTNSIKSVNVPAQDPIVFTYIDKDNNLLAEDVTEVDSTSYMKDETTKTDLIDDPNATFQTMYLGLDGKFHMMYGTKPYVNMNDARLKYFSEEKTIPSNLNQSTYVGGLILRKDAVTFTDDGKHAPIYATKWGEYRMGGGGTATTPLLKKPVADLAALRALKVPVDGETRQILHDVPNIVMYTFNAGNDDGMKPDDGTAGSWHLTTDEPTQLKFIGRTELAAADGDKPTLDEVIAFVGVKEWKDTIIYYTTTDVVTDITRHSYYVNDAGTVVLLSSDTPEAYDHINIVKAYTGNTFPTGIAKGSHVYSLDNSDVYTSNGDGSFKIINRSLFNDYMLVDVKDHHPSYRFDKVNNVMVQQETEGLRGDPVETMADLTKLDARPYERRLIRATKDEFDFYLTADLTPKMDQDPESVADDNATGKWVKQKRHNAISITSIAEGDL